jgi:hypothetical protein
MKIRNRLADIKVLQTHILQDYFKMELTVSFKGDEWKTEFHKRVQVGVNSQYSRSYMGAWDKIQIKGIDNYSVDDMDTTIIITILKGRDTFESCSSKKINQSLDNLQDDRNIDAHTTANEPDSELLQWAYGSLHNISKFVADVAKSSHASDENKNSFAKKYQGEIDTLRQHFEDDYKEALLNDEIEQTIKRDIAAIRTSKDPRRTSIDIFGKYFKTKNSEGRIDFDLMYKFLHAEEEAGFLWACSHLGDRYFDGLMFPVDYKKAEKYYSEGFNEISPQQKLNLASIYNNNLGDTAHSKEEVREILKTCESPRWEIITYTTKDGYEFYSMQRLKRD